MKAPKIELINIATLTADPQNVRKHDARNLTAIKNSLSRFGQQKPIVVNEEGVVIAGNGQLAAAQELGWTQIAVIKTKLSGAEATAYAIADNRTAEFARWDDDALLQSLQNLDAELQGFAGFTADEMAAMAFSEDIESEEDRPRHDPDKYEARVLKQIVLIFGLEQYERVFDALAEYAEQHGLTDNSEVVVHLLEKNGHAVSTRQ